MAKTATPARGSLNAPCQRRGRRSAPPRQPPDGAGHVQRRLRRRPAGQDPAEVLLRADRALYRAKAAGRNQTAIASPDQPLGPAALSSLT
jgi:hypothetical protein